MSVDLYTPQNMSRKWDFTMSTLMEDEYSVDPIKKQEPKWSVCLLLFEDDTGTIFTCEDGKRNEVVEGVKEIFKVGEEDVECHSLEAGMTREEAEHIAAKFRGMFVDGLVVLPDSTGSRVESLRVVFKRFMRQEAVDEDLRRELRDTVGISGFVDVVRETNVPDTLEFEEVDEQCSSVRNGFVTLGPERPTPTPIPPDSLLDVTRRSPSKINIPSALEACQQAMEPEVMPTYRERFEMRSGRKDLVDLNSREQPILDIRGAEELQEEQTLGGAAPVSENMKFQNESEVIPQVPEVQGTPIGGSSNVKDHPLRVSPFDKAADTLRVMWNRQTGRLQPMHSIARSMYTLSSAQVKSNLQGWEKADTCGVLTQIGMRGVAQVRTDHWADIIEERAMRRVQDYDNAKRVTMQTIEAFAEREGETVDSRHTLAAVSDNDIRDQVQRTWEISDDVGKRIKASVFIRDVLKNFGFGDAEIPRMRNRLQDALRMIGLKKKRQNDGMQQQGLVDKRVTVADEEAAKAAAAEAELRARMSRSLEEQQKAREAEDDEFAEKAKRDKAKLNLQQQLRKESNENIEKMWEEKKKQQVQQAVDVLKKIQEEKPQPVPVNRPDDEP